MADGYEEYPAIQGTGFFCSKNGSIFYVTARHCLTKDHRRDVAEFAVLLRIPYTETNEFDKKTVAFDSVFSVTHQSEEIPGTYLDAVAFRVSESIGPELMSVLLQRSIHLPPSGEWFNNFIHSDIAKPAYEEGNKIPLIGMGFPLAEPYSQVYYPNDESELTEINVKAISFKGEIGKGIYADRVKLNDITWPGNMDGMSGSPMFVHFTLNGKEAFALAGMLVTASGGSGQLIRIDVLSQLFKDV